MDGNRVAAVIVAAGRGERVGAGLPKQFLPLRGVPVLVRAVRPFQASPLIDEVVVVVPAETVEQVRRLLRQHGLSKVTAAVEGGPTRQESVRRGLAALGASDLVVVHDGARPLVQQSIIARVVEAAREDGAATAALPATETIKVVDRTGRVDATLDRERVWIVQTPQAFRTAWLVDAHERAPQDGANATDDAGLVERAGYPVRVVLGSPENLKITTGDDLSLAEALLDRRVGQRRNGAR